MRNSSIWLSTWMLMVGSGAAYGQWSVLTPKLPAASNAIVLMDVDKVMASPIANRESWQQRFDKAYAAGLIAVPPTTNRVMLAAQIDFETWNPLFELAVLELERDVSVVNIARQTKGTADVVAGLNAVVLQENAYIVELDSHHVAGLAPANRQAVVRWLRETQHRDKPQLSSYLNEALQLTDKIDLVQAIDLEDAIPAEVIRAKLQTSKVIASAKPQADVDKLAALVATLKGVTFEVVFKDDIHARFLIDFGQDAAPLGQLGKPLLLEVLRNHGAWIADFEGWAPSVSAQRLVLTGKLTDSGMRKIFSLIDSPVATFRSPGNDDSGADQSNLAAYTSHAYFKSIQSILEDVRKESRDSVTLGQNAAWLDRWARKIDRLPVLNVDNDMLDYGAFVAAHLRGASDSLKGAGIRAGYRNASTSVPVAYDANAGWISGGYTNARKEENAQGAANALTNCRTLEAGTAAIRRTMTQRYKIEF